MSEKTKNKKACGDAEAAAEAFVSKASFKSDPNGSYTGRPMDDDDKPVQDADDL